MIRLTLWRALAACVLALIVRVGGATAQDALNLPTDLYVLLNEGRVERYAVPAGGVVSVTPPDVFVIDFGIATDGQQIAYRTEAGLFIDEVATLPPDPRITLTPPPPPLPVDTLAGVPPLRGRGETVAWSATGSVAYTTLSGFRVYVPGAGIIVADQPNLMGLLWSPDGRYLATAAEFNIWWIYRLDGMTATLTAAIPSSLGAAWVSAAELAFAPESGGLIVMNLDLQNTQTPVGVPTTRYRLPALTPDGALRVFARDPADETVPEGFGVLSVVPRGGGIVETIGTAPLDLGGGVRWTPDTALMIAFQGGVLALFDPVSGQGFPLPISGAVAYTWGAFPPPDAARATPTLARAGAAATPTAVFPDQFPTADPAQAATLLPAATVPGP